MKKITVLLIIMFLCAGTALQAQKEVKKDFGISFHGFVKTDAFFDTRETISIREGHFYLYPAYESPDINGDDINGKPGFNMLSIQSRLTGKITGPDFMGAKTSGVMEGAFFGAINSDVNTFRLRHAFVKLNWTNTELLVGQYWHPMFITSCFPGVVAFNTGVPFQPFSRNPQIRLTQKFGTGQLIIAANSQRDFTSAGPGSLGSMYQRNAVIPELNAQFHLNVGKSVFGVGGGYKMLMPRTSVASSSGGMFPNLKVDEKVASIEAIAFAKIDFGQGNLKLEGVYGQNMTNLVMLGGYMENNLGVATINDTINYTTYEYTPTNVMSAWLDFEYYLSKTLKIGLFGGFTQNMGTAEDLVDFGNAYGRGLNIESVMRVSPRLLWQSGKVRFAFELDYTQAKYGGNDYEDKYKVVEAESVDNIRGLFAAYLFF